MMMQQEVVRANVHFGTQVGKDDNNSSIISMDIALNLSKTTAEIDPPVDGDVDILTLKKQILIFIASNNNELSFYGGDIKNVLLLDSVGKELLTSKHLLSLSYKDATDASTFSVADIWCIDKSSCVMDSYCSKVYSSSEEVIQPAYRFLDIPTLFCTRCRWLFDPSLVQPAVVAIPGVENLPLMSFACESVKVTDFAYPDSPAMLERESKRFIESNCTAKSSSNDQGHSALATPLLLYLKRKLFGAAKEQQRAIPNYISLTSKAVEIFRRRVESGAQTVLVYEDPEQQRQARRAIDFERVFQYSRESFISAAENGQDTFSEEEAVMIGLMRWFKCDFFSWFRAKCQFCQSTSMKNNGQVAPSPEETTVGWASRTELYECNDCKQITRFPRYNNPSKLMTSRTGRCGEFANAFCLVCRSLGFDARYVLDFTDHVWVEVWIPSLNRFVHADPCERALDTPLMYETGWNKKLTHVLSFSRYGVVDASPRYSRKLSEIILRRNAEVVTESLVDTVIATQDAKLEAIFLQKTASAAQGGGGTGVTAVSWFDMLTIGESRFEAVSKQDISPVVMKDRKACLSGELQALRFLTTKSWKVEEMQGRISGDLDWKLSRGEAGTDTKGAVSSGEDSKSKQTLTAPSQLKWIVDGVVLSSSLACSGSVDILFSTCGDSESGSQLQSKLRKIFDFPDSIVSKFDCRILIGNVPFTADSNGFCGVAVSAESCAYMEKGLEYVLPNDASVETCSIPIANTIAGSILNDLVVVSSRNKSHAVSMPIVRDEFDRLIASPDHSTVLSGLALHSNISNSSKSSLYSVYTPEILNFLIAINVRSTTNAPPVGSYKLTRVEGFTCLIACDLIIALPGESREQLIERARVRCLDSPYLLGFSVHGASAVGVSSGGECALFFSDSGFPLKAMPSHDVYLKSHDLSQRSNVTSNPTIAYSKSYHYMGGGHHGDTNYFDSTTFLTSLSDSDDTWIEHIGNLKRINVWAGRDIVNGLQFMYARDDVEILSPLLSSGHDSPTLHSFVIDPNDKIIRVTVKYGSLIDSITFTTANGIVFKAGGDGGGNVQTLDIPNDSALCGFFGGTGGHLHNFGVVLFSRPLQIPTTSALSTTAKKLGIYRALLALCSRTAMWNCGALNNIQSSCDKERCADIGMLVKLVASVYLDNGQEAFSTCVTAIIAYVKNIIKDVTNKKSTTIRLSNAYLGRTIASARGGLELFAFGPAGFKPTVHPVEGSCLESVVVQLVRPTASNDRKRLYQSWLELYVGFLQGVTTLSLP